MAMKGFDGVQNCSQMQDRFSKVFWSSQILAISSLGDSSPSIPWKSSTIS